MSLTSAEKNTRSPVYLSVRARHLISGLSLSEARPWTPALQSHTQGIRGSILNTNQTGPPWREGGPGMMEEEGEREIETAGFGEGNGNS